MNREVLSSDERQLRQQQLQAEFAEAARAVIAGEREAARAAAAHFVLVERLRVAGLALHFSDQSSGGPKWSEQVVVQRTVVTELAVGAHLSELDARRRVDTAEGLAGAYPATRAALERGVISARHAEKIVQHGVLLPPDAVPAYEDRIVPIAERVSVQRLEREARAAVEDARSTTSVERHAQAAEGRRLVLEPATDGMAWLSLFLPAVEAVAIHNRATALGRALKSSGDPRTLAHLRVDALADLALNGETSIPGAPRGLRAHIRVTVPALTLLGHENAGSAELEGFGPIDRLTALELTRSAPSFQRVLTDPATGIALSCGRTSYRVPAALDELIRTVHSECTFPLSCTSAAAADLDHTVAFADGGETSLGNLSPLCASHHKVKHHTEWKVEQHPGSGGSAGPLTWTSPAGFVYTVQPTPVSRPIDAARLRPRFADSDPARASDPTSDRDSDPDPHPGPGFSPGVTSLGAGAPAVESREGSQRERVPF